MATINQVMKKKRVRSKLYDRLQKPQIRAVCIKIMKMKPKKPNSAQRSVVRVSHNAIINLYDEHSKFKKTRVQFYKFNAAVPGEAHQLQNFSTVLVRRGSVRDLPGVNYKVIRGKYDSQGVYIRRNGRSKYGRKRWKVPKIVYVKKK